MSSSWHHILTISFAVSLCNIEIYRVGDNRRTVKMLTTPHILTSRGQKRHVKHFHLTYRHDMSAGLQ